MWLWDCPGCNQEATTETYDCIVACPHCGTRVEIEWDTDGTGGCWIISVTEVKED